jgi:hypothetical protein
LDPKRLLLEHGSSTPRIALRSPSFTHGRWDYWHLRKHLLLETFTIIQQALDPVDEQFTMIANWGISITRVVPLAINDEDVTGNIIRFEAKY